MYKEIKKNLKESDNPVLDTFINKYKPLYDTKPVMRNNALVADQISFRGSGIPKRVEATYTPGSLKVENEEWGFFVYNGEVDADSMDNMSQYWFYDDYMNREDFKAKIDKAAKDLYNDMSKLYETMASNTEIKESVGKKVFEVTIEETVSETFEVEATDIEEAMEIAEEKYDDGEFVLEPGDLTSKQMMCRDPETDEETSWVEF